MDYQQFVPYAAVVLAVGVFLWRVFVRTLSGMEARFDDRFGQMERRFDDRFGQVDRQFAQMESRFDDRFAQVDRQFAQMESRFDDRFAQVDRQFAQMESRFDDRFASLDGKVDGLAADHHRLSRELSEFRGEMRGRLSMLVPDADAET